MDTSVIKTWLRDGTTPEECKKIIPSSQHALIAEAIAELEREKATASRPNGQATDQEVQTAKTITAKQEPAPGDTPTTFAAWQAQSEKDTTYIESEEEIEARNRDKAIEMAVELLIYDGKTDSEIRAILSDEFDIDDANFDVLIKAAHKKVVEVVDDGRKASLEAVSNLIEVEQERDRHLVDKYSIAGRLDKAIDPNDTERAKRLIIDHEKKSDAEARKEFDDAARHEPFPGCPIFPGPLTDLARAIYPSLPLELKQWSLLTRWGLMRSGLDYLEFEPHLQPRFYTILVSEPDRGKTGAINESRNSMEVVFEKIAKYVAEQNNLRPTNRVCAKVENLPSADSGPALVEKFFKRAKAASRDCSESSCSDNTAKIILDPDELGGMFEKARATNGKTSTLFDELLKLHSGNRTGNTTKRDGDLTVNNAHLAILAGATTEDYPLLWIGTGGGRDGLKSRFNVITTNAEPAPPVPLRSDFLAAEATYGRLAQLAQLPGQVIRFSEEAGAALNNWWASIDTKKSSTTRILEMVKQVLIVLTVTNAPEGHVSTVLTIGPDLVQRVIDFANYEIQVRERLNPADSSSNVQAMENAIIAWMQKNAGMGMPRTRNDCRRGIHPQRKPGGLGAFNYAWRNCIEAGVLKVRDTSQRDQRYSL